MPDFLQDYLSEVPQGLDSLLSLIPAKNYYVEDATDSWNKKKQTKAEATAARRAKLDPESKHNRNVKEAWDEEQSNKRKLEDLEDDDQSADDAEVEAIEGIEIEKPLEGLKRKPEQAAKKQKVQNADGDAVEPPTPSKKALEKAAKREAKKAKKEAQKDAPKADESEVKEEKKSKDDAKKSKPVKTSESSTSEKQDNDHWETEDEEDEEQEQEEQEAKGDRPLKNGTSHDAAEGDASTSESDRQSPLFDEAEPTATNDTSADLASTTTSISSAVPPSEKPKHIKIPADTSALRARLAAKIETLRAARKADGTDGRPIRTRQELIESRRFKQAQRKEHKKELRRKAKIEEDLKREEALASNSPSVMSPAVEIDETGFAFGRVAFGDGTQLSHDLSYVLNQGKKKGPSDPKTALLKVQNAKKRLAELDEDKRKDIAEKDTWLTARRRAQGERIRDDENMLKKAVKRKEIGKKKSEAAWSERKQGVAKAAKDRQKKREENLQKKRDEKNAPKGKKKKKAAAMAGKKKGGRPGFEGTGLGGKRK